jgi:hypothetical protein
LKKNLIIIIAHQDDEFCIFNRISNYPYKKNIFVFYMTSGMDKNFNKTSLNKRDIESINVLRRLGLEKKNIFFLGRKCSINNNQLYKNLNIALKTLLIFLKKINGFNIVYTHALEGGHEDHDACNYLVKVLNRKFNFFNKCYQFPAYHGKNLPYIFFRVLSPISENGKIYKKKYIFSDRFRFICLLFFYKSQLKTWLGLYPFIIFKYLFYKNDEIQEIKKSFFIRRPHKGKLLYEKRGYCTYDKFEKKIIKFIKT